MLVNAAAVKWNLDTSTCKASKGIITNLNGGKLGYCDVVKEAVLVQVPEDTKLKKVKDGFSVILKVIFAFDRGLL